MEKRKEEQTDKQAKNELSLSPRDNLILGNFYELTYENIDRLGKS